VDQKNKKKKNPSSNKPRSFRVFGLLIKKPKKSKVSMFFLEQDTLEIIIYLGFWIFGS